MNEASIMYSILLPFLITFLYIPTQQNLAPDVLGKGM